MSQMQLPKWGDLNTLERHKLLGELIDAMIYSGEAVSYLQRTVEEFRSMGLIKSIILPENDFEEDCPYCGGEGCTECVIILNDEL